MDCKECGVVFAVSPFNESGSELRAFPSEASGGTEIAFFDSDGIALIGYEDHGFKPYAFVVFLVSVKFRFPFFRQAMPADLFSMFSLVWIEPCCSIKG